MAPKVTLTHGAGAVNRPGKRSWAIPHVYVRSRRNLQPRNLRKLASDIPGVMQRKQVLMDEDVLLAQVYVHSEPSHKVEESWEDLDFEPSIGTEPVRPIKDAWADVERWLRERSFEHSVEHWLPLQQLWQDDTSSWPRNLRMARASDASLRVPGPQPRQSSAEEWRFYPLDVAPPGTRGRRHKSVPDWAAGWQLHFHGDHIYHVSCYMACGEVLPEESDDPSRPWGRGVRTTRDFNRAVCEATTHYFPVDPWTSHRWFVRMCLLVAIPGASGSVLPQAVWAVHPDGTPHDIDADDARLHKHVMRTSQGGRHRERDWTTCGEALDGVTWTSSRGYVLGLCVGVMSRQALLTYREDGTAPKATRGYVQGAEVPPARPRGNPSQIPKDALSRPSAQTSGFF